MKIKFSCLFAALILIISVFSSFGQIDNELTLNIAPAGNQSVLFFPTAISNYNYIVQYTTNLASTNWVAATDAMPVIAFTVSNVSARRFFRLYLDTNSPLGMVLIPAGTFVMGDSLDHEGDASPTISVNVSAFFMDATPTSLNQWQNIYGWAVTNGYGFVHSGFGKAQNHPVQTIDWYDAVKWCNARSQQEGLTPVYYTDGEWTQIFTNGEINISNTNVNWAANGYRLPTEAEWEKAARGGLSGQRFPWGNTISETQANYASNLSPNYDLGPSGNNSIGVIGGSPYTSPVGSFPPNGFGLYDMSGNVIEWCWDWQATYTGGTDPHGPSVSTGGKVARGGAWNSNASQVTCATRVELSPPQGYYNVLGFRCVRAH